LTYDNSAGTIQLEASQGGGASGAENININVDACNSQSTNGATLGVTELSTNDIMVAYAAFDASTDEYLQYSMVMPDNWTPGANVQATFYWTTSATAGTGNVIWGAQAVAISNDDALDAAFGTAQTVTDAFIADKDLHISSATSSVTIAGTPAAADTIVWRFYRDADNASDTYTQDTWLLRVVLTINN